MKEAIIEKLEKLRAKAINNSNTEEAATAQRLYDKMLAENGLKESDLVDSQTKTFAIAVKGFTAANGFKGLIATQILKSMEIEFNVSDSDDKDFPKNIIYDCTKLQNAEFLARLNFYVNEWEREIYIALKAFLYVNKLFNAKQLERKKEETDQSNITQEEHEMAARVLESIMIMRPSSYHKPLE